MMRDVIQAADLSLYPQVGLIFFFAIFVSVLAYAMWGMSAEDRDEVARSPLDDDATRGGAL